MACPASIDRLVSSVVTFPTPFMFCIRATAASVVALPPAASVSNIPSSSSGAIFLMAAVNASICVCASGVCLFMNAMKLARLIWSCASFISCFLLCPVSLAILSISSTRLVAAMLWALVSLRSMLPVRREMFSCASNASLKSSTVRPSGASCSRLSVLNCLESRLKATAPSDALP